MEWSSRCQCTISSGCHCPRPGGLKDASKRTWCSTSTETMRLIRDGEKGGRGYGGGGSGKLYTYRYTVTTRMTSALRWAAMRAILMFHNCEGRQSHKAVSIDHNFWRERRAEADSTRGPSAYQPNALPLGQTGSRERRKAGLSLFAHSHTASFSAFVSK